MSAYPFPAAPPGAPTATATDPTAVFGRRVAAIVVDFLLFLLIMAFVGPTPLSPLAQYYEVPDGVSDVCEAVRDQESVSSCVQIGDRVYFTDSGDAAVQIVVWLAVVGLYAALQGATGTTPGKAIFGIKAVNERGAKPGFGRSLGRTLLWVVDAAPWCLPLVGFITGLTTKGHRRVGDMACKTFVVGKAHTGPVVVPGLATAAATGPWGPQQGGAGPAPWGGPPPQSGQPSWGGPQSGAYPPPGASGPPLAPPGRPAAAPGAPPAGARPAGPPPGGPSTPPTAARPAPPGAAAWNPPGAATAPSGETPAATPSGGPAASPPSSAPSAPPASAPPDDAPPADRPATEPTDGPGTSGRDEAEGPGSTGEPTGATDRPTAAAPTTDTTGTSSPTPSPAATPTSTPGAAPTPSGAPAAAAGTGAAATGYNPQWDAARGTYIVWEPQRGQWLGWDEASKQWRPL